MGPGRREAMDCAVMFADVAGSTALYEVLGDERAFALIDSGVDTT